MINVYSNKHKTALKYLKNTKANLYNILVTVVSRSRKVDLVSFYFLSHFHFIFDLFSFFYFLEPRVRVKTHEHKKKGIEG